MARCFCGNDLRDDGRRIEIPVLTVRWGGDDLRDDWSGGYRFCSFGCLAKWAGEKAGMHDGHVLKDGVA